VETAVLQAVLLTCITETSLSFVLP